MRENTKETELFRMKLIATSLLAIAATFFLLSAYFGEHIQWLGFVRATAEAAMVGAIADWFAVTALFRHPLGLRIPHTAIIPAHKQKIADGFGKFVRDKFLSEEVILQKLQSMDVTRKAAEWVSQPQNSAQVADEIVNAIAATTNVMKDQDVQAAIEGWLAAEIRSTSFAPKIGELLDLITSSPRRQEILRSLSNFGLEVLRENRNVIESGIRKEIPGPLKGVITRPIYARIEKAVNTIIREVNSNPDHPLHERFDAAVRQFIAQLQNSPDVTAKEKEIKEELLGHSVFREFAISLWDDLKTALIQRGSRSNDSLRKSVQKMLSDWGETILRDEALFEKVDRWVNGLAVYLVNTYGYELESLISNTINSWDAKKTSQEIELQVGKDLQFIRINGTVIGGLVGFTIYEIFSLIKLL